jgi:hypothetical protein
MQKDNKISTLEAKLGSSSPVETKVKQYAALKNPNMRQVQPGNGKITKGVENAEKIVMETISKKPKLQQEQPKQDQSKPSPQTKAPAVKATKPPMQRTRSKEPMD